ncbi:Beta-lytic metalloendopeptidase (fragment) [Micrococcus sp. 116]
MGHAAAPDEPRAPAALRRGARARRRDPHRRGGPAGPELAQGAAHRARRPRAARHLRLSPGLPPRGARRRPGRGEAMGAALARSQGR